MKKVLAILAIGAFFAACNNASESTEAKADSAVQAVDAVVDSAKADLDSAANAIVDTAKAKVDSLKK
jgi:PBP1b-binding outer membrane lipoprotein LpoB